MINSKNYRNEYYKLKLYKIKNKNYKLEPLK